MTGALALFSYLVKFKDTQHNGTQHNGTQHNDTQNDNKNAK